MPFKLGFTTLASGQLSELESRDPKKHKRVIKCLALLEADPKYPGLNSHRYNDYDEVHGEKIWESYVENKTPGAYRVFWHYGPYEGLITVVAIVPHP